ncbi:MAG TPA: double zinc ribbon domain-containing protein [Solirubrobacteraceae bacterium]
MRSRVLAEIVALVAPPLCLACHEPLPDAGSELCASCRRALPWLRGERCERCGLPAPCGRCPARRAAFGRAWAPLAYAGPARAIVGALKFRGALDLADLMAGQIAAGAPATLLDPEAVLVPVPLHPRRRRTRGFDQAALLAEALARRSRLELAPALRRTGAARRQLGSGRATRLAPGRIEIVAPGPVPARAVLVDDVHTTGATFDACARALRAAGARRVDCVSYARTL